MPRTTADHGANVARPVRSTSARSPVGGGAAVSVQSMTTTKTADVEGTLAQIYALAAAGADIVRCTCNEHEAAEGLAQIVPRSPVPIVADIHFHVEMALAALEAGVHGLRLNPGNLRKPEEIKLVAAEARDRGVPIRIGVNAGSLHPDLYKSYGGATPEALVESARIELAYFAEVGFDDVKISVKASNVPLMVAAYRLASATFDHPLHLGVTEAGPPPGGLIKTTAGIGTSALRRDRRHDPLLADRRPGRGGPGRPQAARGAGAARAQGARPHRLPVVRPGRDRRHRRGPASPGGPRVPGDPPPGRRHGLCRERPGRGSGRRPRHRRRPPQGPPFHQGQDRTGRARRPRWSRPSSPRRRSSSPRASRLVLRPPTQAPRPRPRRTAGPVRGQGRRRQQLGPAHRDDPQDHRPRAGAPVRKATASACPASPARQSRLEMTAFELRPLEAHEIDAYAACQAPAFGSRYPPDRLEALAASTWSWTVPAASSTDRPRGDEQPPFRSR